MAGWADYLNVVVGVLQLSLALLVMRHLGRFGRAFPWLAALMIYFALRGLDRIAVAFFDEGAQVFDAATDVVLVVVIVLLIVGIERTVSGLKLALDSAELRESEYERALADYRILARHRLANPITAIVGGLATLRDMPELDRQAREEVLAGMEEAARELGQVSLDPRPEAPEERTLRPRPDL
jgi:signal transduction histidine kinase